jgi:hypothetical protein
MSVERGGRFAVGKGCFGEGRGGERGDLKKDGGLEGEGVLLLDEGAFGPRWLFLDKVAVFGQGGFWKGGGGTLERVVLLLKGSRTSLRS